MLKILVPLDGSECALRALAFAIQRAQEAPGSSLSVLTVHQTPIVYGEIEVYVGKARMEQLAAQHDQQVLRAGEERIASAGVPYAMEAIEGDPAEVIARRAKELGCDLIIMGTRGLGRIGNLVMGSIAIKVVHLTTLPVTLVK
jgi:nucleotide-binding universal stress UspA family protein